MVGIRGKLDHAKSKKFRQNLVMRFHIDNGKLKLHI